MTHRCRDCPNRPMFSLRTGTVMQGSNLGYQTWAIAIYLLTTGIKGTSSLKLHRDLEITQKSAWFLMHRLRKSLRTIPRYSLVRWRRMRSTSVVSRRTSTPKIESTSVPEALVKPSLPD